MFFITPPNNYYNPVFKLCNWLNSNLTIKELEITFTEHVQSHASCKAYQIGKLVICSFYLTFNNGTGVWENIATLPVEINTAPNFAWYSKNSIAAGSVEKVDGITTIRAFLNDIVNSEGRFGVTFAFTVL